MGFDVSQVTSDSSHYDSFVCRICNNLANLESGVVVTSYNNVYCESCLVGHVKKCTERNEPCLCPVTSKDLRISGENAKNDGNTSMQVDGGNWIAAAPLKDAQPLAFLLLQMVQVRCPTGKAKSVGNARGTEGPAEYWAGNYGDLPSNLLLANDRYTDSPVAASKRPPVGSSIASKGPSGAPPLGSRKPGEGEGLTTLYDAGVEPGERANVGVTTRGTGAHHKRMVDASVVLKKVPVRSPGGTFVGVAGGAAGASAVSGPSHNADAIDVVPDYDYDPEELMRAMERCDKLKKQANAKFNRADVEGARVLYSEGLALLSDFPLDAKAGETSGTDQKIESDIIQEVRIMVASLYSNRAVTFYRERILSPSVEDCNKSLELDPKSEKTYIRKWRALDAMGEKDKALACLQAGAAQLPNSTKLHEQLRKSLAPAGFGGPNQRKSSDQSIASMSYAYNDKATVASSGGVFGNHEMDISVAGDPNHTVLDRAERLKKQANAKFNKGDIEAARALYSDALACIPTTGFYSRGVKALLSELYSNRAVTFYRSKQYQESLDDCDKAIERNPEAEKSYIRKARALVGLERQTDASRCLQDAYKLFPTSKKVKEELSKIIDQRDTLGNLSGKGGSSDSVDFNASVGSLSNFYPPSHTGSKAAQTLSTGREELTYADDIELSDKLKRNANAKFNRGDVAGARMLYTEAMAVLPNDRENEVVRTCLASLYANRAVTYYRDQEFGQSVRDCENAIELDPKGEKPYSRKARALASMQRYDDAIQCLEEGKRQVPGSDKLEEELVKIKQEVGDAIGTDSKAGGAENANLGHEAGHAPTVPSATDANDTSNFFVPTVGAAMGSVPEGKSQEFDLPTKIDPEEFERAEKLKKQANAKLNKGDVPGARVLYGEGLACMPPGGEHTPEGRELAANLYANRAVTYFREKQFRETVNDCNKAVEFDPKHEKSYIRKWRALMALGSFDDAYRCLESALKELPESERLNEELENAKEEKKLITQVNELIEAKDYQKAHDILHNIVKVSDNVALWLSTARVDTFLGLTDSALSRVEKVLGFNPKHGEALRVRGYATFLSGEMEQGINLLKESLEGDIEDTSNDNASGILQACQIKMNTFHKGQARVKRGRSREAVDLFTAIMEDGQEPIPHGAPLYGILLTERAEANLLSDQYEAALADCAEAISLKQDNLTAWTVKTEVYYALGRLQEARDELAVARKTWGARNETIEDAYKKTDFELRLQKVDNELRFLVGTVESGKPLVDESGILHMNHSQRGNRNGLTASDKSNSNSKSSSKSNSNSMVPPSPMKRSSDINGHVNKRAQSRGKQREGFKLSSVLKSVGRQSNQ
ncbi:unnamed protein product [Pseudo-nitzschia multistriata]|uniref:Uncharacterized protein n=1 Tax=Pseudo-nitzschia multistriata TaxID=183589 RepID=A0A448ZCA0_9STRA|nr:unnamed protein product [Pseudo-nitzschia multistriata]